MTEQDYGSLATDNVKSGFRTFLHQQLCLRCGAVVADTELHDRWHTQMTLLEGLTGV